MATLQVRMDDRLRAQAQSIAAQMGLDLSTAVRLFLAQMVTEKGLPFKPGLDPFYSVGNQAVIKNSIEELNAGRTVTKTIEELDLMG